MAQYKSIRAKNGRLLYYKDGSLVAFDNIPEAIRDELVVDKALDDTKPEYRTCIFCGEHGSDIKTLNSQTIALCKNHYDTETSGAIVAKLKDLQHA